jgi:hypothetical protein
MTLGDGKKTAIFVNEIAAVVVLFTRSRGFTLYPSGTKTT